MIHVLAPLIIGTVKGVVKELEEGANDDQHLDTRAVAETPTS